MEQNSKTVGQASLELSNKQSVDTRDPIELQRAMQSDYVENIFACAKRGRSIHQGLFYLVVVTKKERLMQNVIRSYFMHRNSCPTPDYDQTVYSFDPASEKFELLWVIPAQDICDMFYTNSSHIINEETDLLKYVIDFYNGDLLKLAKKLNGERADSNILEA